MLKGREMLPTSDLMNGKSNANITLIRKWTMLDNKVVLHIVANK